jgi:hypothetical protein
MLQSEALLGMSSMSSCLPSSIGEENEKCYHQSKAAIRNT